MANFKIITNNPMASAKYPELAEFHDTSAELVLIFCRDAVHKGAVLINHPLSGGIAPNQNPYKSLIVSLKNQQTDFMSVKLIENALEAINKTGIKKSAQYDSSILEDFQIIDLDILDSAMNALPPGFY